MSNNDGNPGDGPPSQGNGAHKGELRRQMPNVPPELLTFFTQGAAAAEAEAQTEHDKWKATKVLDDLVGKDTEKWIKRFCVATVTVYHKSVEFAHGKPNAEAIKALALRTALNELSKLCPNIPRENHVQLLNYTREELEER